MKYLLSWLIPQALWVYVGPDQEVILHLHRGRITSESFRAAYKAATTSEDFRNSI